MAKRAFSLEPEMEAFDEQQTVSVQVDEKGILCLSFFKTFYQSICYSYRLKGKSFFRRSKQSPGSCPLISDICNALGLARLYPF